MILIASRVRIPSCARKGKERKRVNDFIAVEDGHTFLSREELDDYRAQKALMEYEEEANG